MQLFRRLLGKGDTNIWEVGLVAALIAGQKREPGGLGMRANEEIWQKGYLGTVKLATVSRERQAVLQSRED